MPVIHLQYVFLCHSVQLQVVEDGSSATSPDTPESTTSKIPRQKGQSAVFDIFKLSTSKSIIIKVDNNS